MKIFLILSLFHSISFAAPVSPDEFMLEKYKTNNRFFSLGVESEGYESFSREEENWETKNVREKVTTTNRSQAVFRKTFTLNPYYYLVVSPYAAGVGRTLLSERGENSLAEYHLDFQKVDTGERLPFLGFRGRNIRSIGLLGVSHASEVSYRLAKPNQKQEMFWDFTVQTGPRYSLAKNWLIDLFTSITFSNFLVRAGQVIPRVDIDGFSQKYAATLQVSALLGQRWVFTFQQSYSYIQQSFREFTGNEIRGYVRVRDTENMSTVNVQFLL
jgi:hypothetical protein